MVMVHLHEAGVIRFLFPHVRGGVLAPRICPEKRFVTYKTLLLPGFPPPHFTIGNVSGHILTLDLKKNHVDEHDVTVIARSEATKQSLPHIDCFASLAMTYNRLSRF